jgi:hypothetical protein
MVFIEALRGKQRSNYLKSNFSKKMKTLKTNNTVLHYEYPSEIGDENF